MSTTTTNQPPLLLQHPSHEHPLELWDLSKETRPLYCRLCHRKISTEAYSCKEGCQTGDCYHRVCVKAPPQIDRYPLYPTYTLPLVHCRPSFRCDVCRECFDSGCSSFRCDECDFDLDIGCALSALSLSDEGGSQGGKTPEQIFLPLHPHTLTSFSTGHHFIKGRNCCICQGRVEGDGYLCLRRQCEFVIHKRCIHDLYYADGTKAPRVYHCHPLEVFVGEDTGSRTCASCGSDKSGEFIGCANCEEFYHRHCFQVPEILRYPSHNPNHTLVLFPDAGTQPQCQSCSSYIKNEIYYRCTSCEFFLHIGCAFQVLAYCEEGMSAKIELSWHKHPLLLCHQTQPALSGCSYCREKLIGPNFVCEENCGFRLHKRCSEIKSKITHPQYPDHPLILCERDDYDDPFYICKACGVTSQGLKFSSECFSFDLDIECAGRFPTHKHYLHQHELLRLEKYRDLECNRCGRNTDSPLFRCVPCDFNLHEECMELPQVVESKIHWHPLTLHETFLEDDSGEYYCEHCEKARDPRLGVYVCGECKLSMPRIYHIECALPEIRKVYEKKSLLTSDVEKLDKQITDKRKEVFTIKEKVRTMTEEVHTMKEKLEGATRELDGLVQERDILVRGCLIM